VYLVSGSDPVRPVGAPPGRDVRSEEYLLLL